MLKMGLRGRSWIGFSQARRALGSVLIGPARSSLRLVLKAQSIHNFNGHTIRDLRGGDDVSYQELGPCAPTLPCRFPLSLADKRFSAERKACRISATRPRPNASAVAHGG